MLRPFCYFSNSPWPMDLSLGNCSFGCKYCFAILNGRRIRNQKDIEGDFKKLVSQLNRAAALPLDPDRPIDLVDYWIQKRYGCTISNNVDPFTPTNVKFYPQVLELLRKYGIPASVMTKSGRHHEFTSIMGKDLAACYSTITTMDAALAKSLEPGCPSPAKRLDDLVTMAANGYFTEVAINPWVPELTDGRDVVDAAISNGIKNFCIHPLHLSTKQTRNLDPKCVLHTPVIIKQAQLEIPSMRKWTALLDYIHERGGLVQAGILNPSPDDPFEALPATMNKWPYMEYFSKMLYEEWKEYREQDGPGENGGPAGTAIIVSVEKVIDAYIESIGEDQLLKGPTLRDIANVNNNLPKSMNTVLNKEMRLSGFIKLLWASEICKFAPQGVASASYMLATREKGTDDAVFAPELAVHFLQDAYSHEMKGGE